MRIPLPRRPPVKDYTSEHQHQPSAASSTASPSLDEDFGPRHRRNSSMPPRPVHYGDRDAPRGLRHEPFAASPSLGNSSMPPPPAHYGDRNAASELRHSNIMH
ncbi:hypothetical protein ZWY2020_036249 [Hordeum vulgare]|nr:hypothetical protein ZWY2020_036249 [Hordeum vulgare]